MAGIMDRIQKLWNPDDDDYDDDDEFEGEDIESYSRKENSTARDEVAPTTYRQNPKPGARVVNVNQKPAFQVVVYKPLSFSKDTGEIAHTLIAKNAVVVNLENTEKAESRRILDFLSGVAFAQNGKVSKVSTATYIITPYNVDLSGEEILDSFDDGTIFF